MKPQLIIVEDDLEKAQYYEELLNLDSAINHLKVIYERDFNAIKLLLKKKGIFRAFLVDINLDDSNKEDRTGLEIVQYIRKFSPKSLITVYSGFSDAKNEAYQAGANYFFEKNPSPKSLQSDFLAMRNSILHFYGVVDSLNKSSKELNEIIKEDLEKDLEEIGKDIAFYENLRSDKKALLKRLIEDKMGAHSGDSESMMRIEKKILKVGEEVDFNKLEIDNCRRKRNDIIKRKNNLLI